MPCADASSCTRRRRLERHACVRLEGGQGVVFSTPIPSDPYGETNSRSDCAAQLRPFCIACTSPGGIAGSEWEETLLHAMTSGLWTTYYPSETVPFCSPACSAALVRSAESAATGCTALAKRRESIHRPCAERPSAIDHGGSRLLGQRDEV